MGLFKFEKNNKEAVLKASDEAVERALEIVGMQAENYARANTPVDTGLLRNSITSAVGGKSTRISSYHADKARGNMQGVGFYGGTAPTSDQPYVIIGSNVEYAPYQELGTSKMGACNGGRGFLRPAINDHMSEYKSIVQNELKNG